MRHGRFLYRVATCSSRGESVATQKSHLIRQLQTHDLLILLVDFTRKNIPSGQAGALGPALYSLGWLWFLMNLLRGKQSNVCLVGCQGMKVSARVTPLFHLALQGVGHKHGRYYPCTEMVWCS